MRNPMALIVMFLFAIMLVALVQIGIFQIALDKLGLSEHSAMLILFSSLFGSLINLPLARMQVAPGVEPLPPPQLPSWMPKPPPFTGQTIIAINVGGAIVPLLVSLYLYLNNPLALWQCLITILLVSLVCYRFSRPIKGLGIGMPVFIAPITAVLLAWVISPTHSAPLAYIGGTLGVLVGADILRLRDVRHLAAPIASIGGAGTFDGIFITGIVAVLLA